MNLRLRLLIGTDRLLALVLVAILAGTTLAFGGRVWWAPVTIAALCLALVALCLVRTLARRDDAGPQEPADAPGTARAGAGRRAARAAAGGGLDAALAAVARGVRARASCPTVPARSTPASSFRQAPQIRSPVTLDRSATLRWLAGASACLAVFWGVAQYADRLGRLYVVWGSVVAGFFLNTAVAAVQVVCGSKGLFGFIEPGVSPSWSPNWNDLLTSPNASVLRAAGEARPGHPAWAMAVPDRPFLLGSQMGGPGAYLALGSLGLPLALALTLQLLAPRGSRESLGRGLGQSGQGSLVVLLSGMLLASALLVGLLAGPSTACRSRSALIVVGLPGAWPTGLRWSAVGLTS